MLVYDIFLERLGSGAHDELNSASPWTTERPENNTSQEGKKKHYNSISLGNQTTILQVANLVVAESAGFQSQSFLVDESEYAPLHTHPYDRGRTGS